MSRILIVGGPYEVTDDNVDDYYDGVMIEFTDFPSGTRKVPGWECRACHWRVGAQGLPPTHTCPADGERQNGRYTGAGEVDAGVKKRLGDPVVIVDSLSVVMKPDSRLSWGEARGFVEEMTRFAKDHGVKIELMKANTTLPEPQDHVPVDIIVAINAEQAQEQVMTVLKTRRTDCWRANAWDDGSRHCLNCGKVLTRHRDQMWCPTDPENTTANVVWLSRRAAMGLQGYAPDERVRNYEVEMELNDNDTCPDPHVYFIKDNCPFNGVHSSAGMSQEKAQEHANEVLKERREEREDG